MTMSPWFLLNCVYTQVPFEEVPELFASRRVFLQKGFAYVAMNQVHVKFIIFILSNSIGCDYNLIIVWNFFSGCVPCCYSIPKQSLKVSCLNQQVTIHVIDIQYCICWDCHCSQRTIALWNLTILIFPCSTPMILDQIKRKI